MSAERILVVDDEPGVRESLEGIFEDEGFLVRTVGSGESAIDAAREESFDAVLLDVWLPGIDGLETLRRFRGDRVDAEVVMISGHGTIETAVRATKLGAFDFVEKPLSLEKTLVVVRNALRARRLERRNLALLEQIARDTEILGVSAAAERLRREVEAAATSDSPVLLRGERGTGRPIVARRIHTAGARAGEAFVEVPCAALDAEAAENVLFGGGERTGRIDLAAGGTLYLEDVERLASGLQDRLSARLGSDSFLSGGARVVASTSPTAEGLGDALLARLTGLTIDIAPLRERREDIAVIVEHYTTVLAREYGRETKRWTPEALVAVKSHDWPGNVRELRHAVEQVLLTVEGPVVEAASLPAPVGASAAPVVDLYGDFENLKEGLAAFERFHVARCVEREAGDLAAAAAKLGMSKDALAKRVRKYGIARG